MKFPHDKSDIYSLGVSFYFILTLNEKYEDEAFLKTR